VTVLKREQILAALAIALGNMPRNIPLGDIRPTMPHKALHDGDAELVEEFINPPVYEWTIRPVMFFVVAWPEQTSPDAALAALIEAAATTLDGIVDQLGGLVTDIRPQAPNFAPQSLWGAANMKGAEVAVEIDYWSESSLG
jgi:hypothetical protein